MQVEPILAAAAFFCAQVDRAVVNFGWQEAEVAQWAVSLHEQVPCFAHHALRRFPTVLLAAGNREWRGFAFPQLVIYANQDKPRLAGAAPWACATFIEQAIRILDDASIACKEISWKTAAADQQKLVLVPFAILDQVRLVARDAARVDVHDAVSDKQPPHFARSASRGQPIRGQGIHLAPFYRNFTEQALVWLSAIDHDIPLFALHTDFRRAAVHFAVGYCCDAHITRPATRSVLCFQQVKPGEALVTDLGR